MAPKKPNAPRSYKDWTPEEDDMIRQSVGVTKLATIARKIGRTPDAVRKRTRHALGLEIKRTAYLMEGMIVADVARELGVNHQRVLAWIDRKWLNAKRAYMIHEWVWTISAESVEQFLRERGALLTYLQPDDTWREIIDDARADLQSRLIGAHEVQQLVGFNRTSFQYLRSQLGFPKPALPFSGALPDYFDRAAVRDWFVAHPKYQTNAVRREFFSNGTR